VHKHTIDWYLQLNLTSDATLAQKRWDTAETLAKTLTRTRVIELLRLFLFAPSGTDFTQQFTNELIGLDAEFPVSHNIQELRMMAGLVMMTTFGKSSDDGNAFALGVRAASFPDGRVQPLQPGMVTEAEEYLGKEAGRLRPDEFANDVVVDVTKGLTARGKALSEAEAAGDEAKKTAALVAYRKSVIDTIVSSHRTLAKRVEQLAEESALLWWVLAEYSDALQQPVHKLTAESYALAAASEAAQRTTHLPPPPSIGPLLARALQSCEPSGKKKLVLANYVKAANPLWRAAHVKSVNVSDCRDLNPLCAALEKTDELGSAPTALRTLSKLCPGVKGELPLTPSQAALQFYNEILFLRALDALAD
jgi:GTPase-associated system helical domain